MRARVQKQSAPRLRARNRLIRDGVCILGGVILGYFMLKSHVVGTFLERSADAPIIASFFAGLFFTSIFTTAPAIAALYEIAGQVSLPTVVFFGALGAVVGDFILYRFIHEDITADVTYLVGKRRLTRIFAIFRTRLFEWFLPFIGALIIASPLPDELGLTLLGFSKLRLRTFIAISFTFNAIGITAIGLFAGAL